MTIEVKFDFEKNREFIKIMVRKEIKKVIKGAILFEIEGGRSPVKGEGRFPKYEGSYKKIIKKGKLDYAGKERSPVNLRVTGDLLVTLFVRETGDGLEIGFDHELADVHNRLGVPSKNGKKIRRMLPTEPDEVFNKNIQEVLTFAIQKGIKKALNIINR